MRSLAFILPYIQIALSIILIAGILLQQTGAGLGGAFGDNFSAGYHTRRGFEKTLFFTTIAASVLFGLSAFLALLVK